VAISAKSREKQADSGHILCVFEDFWVTDRATIVKIETQEAKKPGTRAEKQAD